MTTQLSAYIVADFVSILLLHLPLTLALSFPVAVHIFCWIMTLFRLGDMAISIGHADIVSTLLMAGANAAALDGKGLTALDVALQERDMVRNSKTNQSIETLLSAMQQHFYHNGGSRNLEFCCLVLRTLSWSCRNTEILFIVSSC